jgi:hypothetical protein
MVELDSLCLSVTLRPADDDHVRALTAVISRVPPILVHRGTGLVLDGQMRVLAARAAGLGALPVEWVDDEVTGWLRAIASNSTHGLPLTNRQRAAAARRVLELHPEWSNRRIAESCGVDEATVRRARPHLERPGAALPHLDARRSRDGSRHPVDSRGRREAAQRALAANPNLSNAEVARRVGLSPTTVAAVRRALSITAPPKREAHRLRWRVPGTSRRRFPRRLWRHAARRLFTRLIVLSWPSLLRAAVEAALGRARRS